MFNFLKIFKNKRTNLFNVCYFKNYKINFCIKTILAKYKESDFQDALNKNDLEEKKKFIFEMLNSLSNNMSIFTSNIASSTLDNLNVIEDKNKLIKLRELIKEITPILSVQNQIWIGGILMKSNIYPLSININLFQEITKINNQNKLDLLDIDTIVHILRFLNEIDRKVTGTRTSYVTNLMISFKSNFSKYEEMFIVNQEKFFLVFNELLILEEKGLHYKNLNYEESIELFDLLSDYILKNLFNIKHLYLLFKLFSKMDKVYYKNNKLNSHVMKEFLSLDKKIDLTDKIKYYNAILLCWINNKTIICNKSSLIMIIVVLHYFTNQTISQNYFQNENNLTINLKIFSRIHCILKNHFKLNDLNPIVIKINNLLSFYVDHVYNKLIIHKLTFENKFTRISLHQSIIYLKSTNFCPEKVNQILNILQNDYSIHHFTNKKIISWFHRDVLKALIQLNIKYIVEDTTDYLSKDIVIEGKKICLELNGMIHYYRNRDIEYNSDFKKQILENYGWTVIDISHFDWMALDEDSKISFIRKILLENKISVKY